MTETADVDTSDLSTSEIETIGIVDAEGWREVGLAAFRRRLEVDGWVRLHPADFDALRPSQDLLVHFNLGTTSNEVGRRYAIVPIVRPGRRLPDGAEAIAYVDVRRVRRSICLAVRQAVSLADLAADDFEHSLPTIRSVQELSAALIGRYARMHPTLSEDALLAKGCAISTFRLDP